MKFISIITTSFLSVFSAISPILDWIFKDKSLKEISLDNRISEVENEYKKALSDIRDGNVNRVKINLKNGDTLVLKSLK
ncbi:hypothetical protein MG290_01690 [Flavobacterium sp. CBA20B-1]|uniref:hypothetical protein n=1 Tax=unclassified Flavobacterium TaxID=196869 RepID=UPI0022255D26|nr:MULTISPECIES: hypothetical protein [unclassified Flavobacterium]WCM42408.1 hypothetical protein MG290_01690 [Flavobacterium sp. CBA20B-1]